MVSLATTGRAAPLLLDAGEIETSQPARQAELRALRGVTPPTPAQRATPRGTTPWLVQFNDVIREETKMALIAAGATLKGYVPENAYLIEATPKVLAAISAWPEVAWAGEYQAAYKRSQPVRTLLAQGLATTRAYSVLLFQGDDVPAVAREIETLTGASVLAATALPDGGLVRAQLTPAQVETISSWGEVQWIEPYSKPRLWNDVSVRTTMMNVSNAWSVLGLTGAGQTIAVADTGLDTGNTNTLHADFSGRVTGFGWSNGAYSASYSWGDTDAHGTHVSGSVLGSGLLSTGRFKGVSYEARLIIQGTQADLSGLPASLAALFTQAFTNGARIHSDSWGYDDHGYYNTDSRAVDQFVWSNRTMLIVIAAGNSGADTNVVDGVVDPMSVASPATAKNCLTVGAAENFRTSGGYSTLYRWGTAWPSDYPANPISIDYLSRPYTNNLQGLAAFSSRGPCNDGRIKPDIVAPGTDIISTRSRAATGTGWGTDTGNTNYLFEGGTSMATPLTAGAAGLARQWVITTGGITNPSAALLKALLLSGARNLAPGQYGTGAQQEIPNVRPNNAAGWGHVDLFTTLSPGTNQFLHLFDTNSLATGQTNTWLLPIGATPTNTFILTLAYADYWGTAGSGKQLVNDLDLTVQTPSGNTLYANGRTSVDATNNVEMIEFTAPETGNYLVRVHGRSVPSGGSQPYALVMRGPLTPAPLLAPVFDTLGTPSTTTGVMVAFFATATGNPAPLVELQASTASTGSYTFAATNGLLTFTPTSADVGTPSFTFLASNSVGTAGLTVTVTVAEATPAAPAAIWASATNQTSFTASWSPVTNAASYRLDVGSGSPLARTGAVSLINEDFVSFTDWTNAGTANNTVNFGAASPCRALGTGDTLTSPTVNYPTQLTFYVDSSATRVTTNFYSLNGGSTWTLLGIFTGTTAGATVTQRLNSSPDLSNSTNVMFRFVSAFNTWYLDDVKVTGYGGPGLAYVPGYSNLTVLGTSQLVTGLTSGTPYFFQARAVNSGGTSPNSETATVTTTTASVAPSFGANPGPFSVTAGVSIVFTVSATGAPLPSLALENSTASAGYTFTPGTGQLSYTPPTNDVGAQSFTFTASNTAGLATQVVSVTVAAPPVLIPVVSVTNRTTNSFTVLWTEVTAATNYQLQVGSDTNFSAAVSGSVLVLATNAATNAVAPTDWTYDISALSANYPILGYATNFVQSPVFSTLGLANLAINFKARTYGGVNAITNTITLSISTNGGVSWNDFATVTPLNTTLTSYGVLDASAYLGHAQVSVKWEARAAGGNKGAGVQAFSITGTQLVSAATLLVDATTTARTYNVTGLAMETTYFVRARASGGLWSDIQPATTLGPEPVLPWFNSDAGPFSTTAGVEVAFVVDAQGSPTPTLDLISTTATTNSYSFAPASGNFTYLPPTNDAGLQTFTFLASNSVGVVSQVVNIAITAATPPAFAPLDGQSATTGVTLAFTVATTDGHPTPVLALHGTTATSGYQFTPDTGLLSYRPTLSDAGPQVFTFTASNVAGVVTQVVDVLVSNAPPTAPTLNLLSPQSTIAGVPLNYTVSATDPDSALVTFACTSAVPPALWTFNTNSGAFSFTPTTNQVGTHIFTFLATDDSGLVSAPSNLAVIVNAAADQVAVSFGKTRIIAEEGQPYAVIPITLAYTGNASVQLRFAGPATGTAQWGSDFNCATTLVVAGASTGEVVLAMVDDLLPEGPESILVSLVPVPPATAGSITQTILHVRDNDALSILAGNITSGSGQSYEAPGSHILEALAPDVALLQEFNMTNSASTNAYRVWVNEHFGTGFSYYVESEPSDNIPNGIVSRWPILQAGEWTDTLVPDRDFAWAAIDLPGTQDLLAVSVHIKASSGYESTRTAEARLLTNYVATSGWLSNGFVVIGGDFNLGRRTETALSVLTAKVVSDLHQPADQNGNKNTNSGRDNPYDLVLPSSNLDARHRPVSCYGYTFTNGLVFDTRVSWTNGLPPPALATDSSALNMQHMAVLKVFELDQPPAEPTLAPPQAFTASAASGSSLDLSFTPNASGDSVVVVWNSDGVFATPSGTPPAAGSALAGGTVLYQGSSSPLSHTGLVSCTTVYYACWSFAGTNYSTNHLMASATTLGPSAPTSIWVSATNTESFTVNWTASIGATDYQLDAWLGPGFPPAGAYLPGFSNLAVTGTSCVITGALAGTQHYARVRAATAACESGASPTASVFIKSAQTIAFPALADQVVTQELALAATASSGLPVSFALVSGPATLTGSTNLTFTATGEVRVAASQAGNSNWLAAATITNSFSVGKATATLLFTELAQIYDGTPRAITATTTPTGLPVSITYDGDALAPSNAGSYAVTGTVVDTRYAGVASGTLVVSPALPLLIWSNPAPISYGVLLSETQLNAEASVPGSFTYEPSAGALLNAGTNALRVSFAPGDALNYRSITGQVDLAVERAPQTISFPLLADQLATNTVELSATASSGLPVLFAVHSGPAELADATNLTLTGTGLVEIVASQAGDTNWLDAEPVTNSFHVSKATALVILTNLLQTYDGTTKTIAAITEPADLPLQITFNETPIHAGAYSVTATVQHALFAGQATGLLVIAQAPQSIDFPPIGHQLTTNTVELLASADSGLPVDFEIITGPALLTGNTLSFSGPGEVIVRALQPGDTNWLAAAPVSNTFTVATLPATVLLSDLSQIYDGTPRAVTATTTPTGLTVNITYDGSATAPTAAGSYVVTGTVVDASYQGAATGQLVIAPATPILAWTNPLPIVFGTTLSETQLNATADVAGTFTYAPPAGTLLNAGTNPLATYFVPADPVNYLTVTGASQLVIERAPQTLNFPALAEQVRTNVVLLAATASSGLPVHFALLDGPGTLVDTTLTFTAAGLVLVTAEQAGDSNWLAAATATNAIPVILFIDANTNAAPDEWEEQYFGSLGVMTGTSDFDGDGRTDFEEYIAGTHPTNGLNFQRLEIGPAGLSNGWKILFATVTGRLYRVEASPSLAAPDWQPVVTNLPGTGAPQEVLDPNPATPRYFRNAVELAP